MRMKRVEGILAVSRNNVVGQGDKIPWHHRGDLRRFWQITMDNGVLMGYPTFKGMATVYTKPGRQVLPGRKVFVVGREPFEGLDELDVNLENVVLLPTHGPKDDIETALKQLPENRKLFIAGGARVYHNYLTYAEKVHLTRIDLECPEDENTVRLSAETSWQLLGINNWRSVTINGTEISDGLKAVYMTLDATT